MGIKARFTADDIKRYMKLKSDQVDQAIISRLKSIGNYFVDSSRNNNTYMDYTGNLRSSIAYVILKNGVILFGNYKLSERGSDKAHGVATAKQVIETLGLGLSKGYVLLCVAGMDYAISVESRGKDVITASSIIAKKQLKDAIAHLSKS